MCAWEHQIWRKPASLLLFAARFWPILKCHVGQVDTLFSEDKSPHRVWTSDKEWTDLVLVRPLAFLSTPFKKITVYLYIWWIIHDLSDNVMMQYLLSVYDTDIAIWYGQNDNKGFFLKIKIILIKHKERLALQLLCILYQLVNMVIYLSIFWKLFIALVRVINKQINK